MTGRTLPRIGVAVFTVIAVLATGTLAGWLWLAPAVPPALSAPTGATTAPISHQEYSDSRLVMLGFSVSTPSPLQSGTTGRVTSTACSAGGAIESGTPLLSVNGQPLLALATSVPLWRDLKVGDHGDDVASLQKEIARLGYSITADGRLGAATLSAIGQLFAKAGDTEFIADTVPAARIIWLPSPSATIASCEAPLGSTLEAQGTISTLERGWTKVFVTEMPTDLLPGERTLTLDSVTVPLGSGGIVSDPEALRKLAETPSAIESSAADKHKDPSNSSTETSQVEGRMELNSPVAISIVPPTAVYDIAKTEGASPLPARAMLSRSSARNSDRPRS